MKIYSIPITWASYKRIEVEAEDLQEAVAKAINQFLSEPDDNYICDSMSIDDIIYDENLDENFNLDQAWASYYKSIKNLLV